MKIFILSICLSFSLIASDKRLMGQMHGTKMIVQYLLLNTGKHVLVIKEKVGINGQKAQVKQKEIIDLNLKTSEIISSYYSFRCRNPKGKYAYAVINKKSAQKKEKFIPTRAWLVDEASVSLSQVKNINSIKCIWFQEGEVQFPF